MKRKSSEMIDSDSFGSDSDAEDDSVIAERKRLARLQEIITQEIKELDKDEIEMFD
jgi:hypothetical protein